MASSPSTAIRKLTESGLARELGVSRQAIHDLVKRDILTKDKDGLIDVEMAKIALANIGRKDSSKRSKNERGFYPCPKCKGFHLTSRRPPPWQAEG